MSQEANTTSSNTKVKVRPPTVLSISMSIELRDKLRVAAAYAGVSMSKFAGDFLHRLLYEGDRSIAPVAEKAQAE